MQTLYLVKARRVGGSIVVTCPLAIEGEYYDVASSGRGQIIYTPVDQAIRKSVANGMNKTLSEYDDED